jgi:uncharacterized protein (DUF362 family)
MSNTKSVLAFDIAKGKTTPHGKMVLINVYQRNAGEPMSDFEEKKEINTERRSVLKLGVAASAAGLLGVGCSLSKEPDQNLQKKPAMAQVQPPAVKKETKKPVESRPFSKPGKVVRVSSPGMRKALVPDAQATRRMVAEAVKALTSEADSKKAWARFVTKDDRVAVKINALGGPVAATQRVITDAVVEGILEAGVPEKNLVVFDQFESSMEKSGYNIVNKPEDMRVLSEKSLGYEPPLQVGAFKLNLAKTLSWATAIINIPVLKEHPMCGISGAIKNMVFGCVESPEFLHENINSALAEIYFATQMRDKVRLHILDGSHVQYDGGPMYVATARAQHDCIYASTDPVAIDAIEWEIIEQYRAKNGLKNLTEAGRPPEFLKLSEQRKLGVADRKSIDLIKKEC